MYLQQNSFDKYYFSILCLCPFLCVKNKIIMFLNWKKKMNWFHLMDNCFFIDDDVVAVVVVVDCLVDDCLNNDCLIVKASSMSNT